jgi:hypothetical protein
MPEETKKLSVEELMNALNDPSLVYAAAAKHGLKVVSPADEHRAALPEPKKRKERPVFSVPEDAEVKDIVKSVAEYLTKQTEYLEEFAGSKSEEVRGEFRMTEERKQLNKIKDFAKTKPDFNEHIPIMEPLVASGKYTVEEAYEIASKAKPGAGDKKTESATQPTVTTPATKVSSFKTSDEGGTPQGTLIPKHASMEDAIKANFNRMIAADPSLKAAFSEEGTENE